MYFLRHFPSRISHDLPVLTFHEARYPAVSGLSSACLAAHCDHPGNGGASVVGFFAGSEVYCVRDTRFSDIRHKTGCCNEMQGVSRKRCQILCLMPESLFSECYGAITFFQKFDFSRTICSRNSAARDMEISSGWPRLLMAQWSKKIAASMTSALICPATAILGFPSC